MKKISSRKIFDTVYSLAVKANLDLRKDFKLALDKAILKEKNNYRKQLLRILVENYKLARKKSIPICQDTGIVVVFLEIGKDINLDFINLEKIINKAVSKAYKDKYFRKSVVKSPILRINTQNNTPCVIHYDFVNRRGLKISLLVKGFGAENKSRLKMMNPTASKQEIIDFIVDTVKKAGPDGCPPYVLGIGIGGTMDKASFLSKKALLEDINKKSKDKKHEEIKNDIKKRVNNLKIGSMGLGGNFTCLGVNILTFPTHIAGLPVAVNINCHALRSASKILL